MGAEEEEEEGASSAGMQTVKVEPSPFVLETVMEPRINSTRPLLKDKPKPLPPYCDLTLEFA